MMQSTAAGKQPAAPSPGARAGGPLPIILALLAVLSISTAACSQTSDQTRLQSDTVKPADTVAPPAGASSSTTVIDEAATPTTERPTTAAGPKTSDAGPAGISTTAPQSSAPTSASADAESFMALAPTIGELGGDVQGFVAATRPIRIDQLAEQACGAVSASMNDGELGVAGLAMYRRLPDDEQAAISVTGWSGLYGALIGFFCPDRLPDTPDRAAQPPDKPGIEQFRTLMEGFAGASRETKTFVAGLDDRRLDQLQVSACTDAGENMNTEEFGLTIVASYDETLRPDEAAEITLSGFSELYGSLVGWFCPSKLPR